MIAPLMFLALVESASAAPLQGACADAQAGYPDAWIGALARCSNVVENSPSAAIRIVEADLCLYQRRSFNGSREWVLGGPTEQQAVSSDYESGPWTMDFSVPDSLTTLTIHAFGREGHGKVRLLSTNRFPLVQRPYRQEALYTQATRELVVRSAERKNQMGIGFPELIYEVRIRCD